MKTALRQDEIREILKKGRRIVLEGMVFLYTPPKKTEKKRFAVIVSKKTLKKNVDRNRVRRIIRELVRKSDIPLDIFIVIYNGKQPTYQNIKKELDTVVEKMRYTNKTDNIQ